MKTVSAIALVTLLCGVALVDGFSLRQRNAAQSPLVVMKAQEDVDYKVVEKKSIEKKTTADCLCPLGQFWHWRIKSCIKQGDWAYECGFFPAEHHDKVCKDTLKCEVLQQNGTEVKYFHPGAVPASCQACEEKDNCLTGKERHSQSCLKEYKLSGEACQTVKVTVPVTASAEATETVTKSKTASASATATASEKATVEDATAKADAKATGKATAKAEAEGKASAKAKATEDGVAEGKACVTVAEVKEALKLTKVPRIGAVLSANVVSTGDEMAFDKAYALALEAAKKAGLINAKEAAKALASAQAREHAGLEAEAKADEAAAWKAEAGAEKNAQNKAKAEALAKAQEAAAAEAAAAAKAAAEARAAADKASGADKLAAEAKAADAAAKAAAAKAAAQAIADVVNPKPTQAPMRPTTAEPTNAPRKITPDQIAAKLP